MRGIHAPHYGPVQAELNGPGIVAPAFFLPLCTEVLRRRILGSSPPALCIATDLHRAVFLEVPSIGWQLFILESYQSDSTAFPSCLDTYATRLLTEPLRHSLSTSGGLHDPHRSECRGEVLRRQGCAARSRDEGERGGEDRASRRQWRWQVHSASHSRRHGGSRRGGSDPAPGLERRHFAPVHRGRRTHADGSRTRGAARDLLSPGGTRSVRGAAWLARGGGRPAPDAAGAGASGPAAAPLHGARRTRICGRGTWLPQVAGSW